MTQRRSLSCSMLHSEFVVVPDKKPILWDPRPRIFQSTMLPFWTRWHDISKTVKAIEEQCLQLLLAIHTYLITVRDCNTVTKSFLSCIQAPCHVTPILTLGSARWLALVNRKDISKYGSSRNLISTYAVGLAFFLAILRTLIHYRNEPRLARKMMKDLCPSHSFRPLHSQPTKNPKHHSWTADDHRCLSETNENPQKNSPIWAQPKLLYNRILS